MFDTARALGDLVPISGTDRLQGEWVHRAFLAHPLPTDEPLLSGSTYRQIARSRAALAALDSTARQLPDPGLLRRPTLGREAQSTSALEGTYAPLSDVLTEDEEAPSSANLREVFNYMVMADEAFSWIDSGRPLTVGLLTDLQRTLVRHTQGENEWTGRLRGVQVVIGRRPGPAAGDVPVTASRFVPAPPGLDLESRVRDLLTWIGSADPHVIDPVVAAAMAHYQFETLHPFHDGNGRIGRLVIVLQLLGSKTLSEPTLTVSPWFEARRGEYYDRLLAVSTHGAWDSWIEFFATGLEAAALTTHQQMTNLLTVQSELRDTVRTSSLRSDNAQKLVDLSIARPSFTARQVERELQISYGRANSLVSQLVELGVLEPVRRSATYDRRFHAPRVLDVLLSID